MDLSFPRATRGWKVSRANSSALVTVSPALRGDGRQLSMRQSGSTGFPPRYAGMEDGRLKL